MAQVEILPKGTMFYVYRNGNFVGRYWERGDAEAVAELARTSDVWPPVSGVAGVRWESGKWRLYGAGRYVRLEDAVRIHADRTKALKEAEGKRKQSSGCRDCVWRSVVSGGSDAGMHCGYSLCYGHHSRVYLHYQRTGRESLEGMIFGKECPEYLKGDPRQKLSLMQDDPGRISAQGWALLKREQKLGRPLCVALAPPKKAPEPKGKPVKTKGKPGPKTAEINSEAAKALKAVYTWQDIGEAAGMHKRAVAKAFKAGRITIAAAQRIKDNLGADILARKGDTHELY